MRVNPLEIPDFAAINNAHRLAEAEGFIDQNQRPVGSVSLEAAYADVAFEASGLAIEYLPPSPARSGNGFGGNGKTHRSEPIPAKSTETQHPVREAVAVFDTITAEDVEEAAVAGAWRGEDGIAEEQARILERADKDQPRRVIEVLRLQPYAKGIATATTAQEQVIAARKLKEHNARKRQQGSWGSLGRYFS